MSYTIDYGRTQEIIDAITADLFSLHHDWHEEGTEPYRLDFLRECREAMLPVARAISLLEALYEGKTTVSDAPLLDVLAALEKADYLPPLRQYRYQAEPEEDA